MGGRVQFCGSRNRVSFTVYFNQNLKEGVSQINNREGTTCAKLPETAMCLASSKKSQEGSVADGE